MPEGKREGGQPELYKLLFLQVIQKSVLCWGKLSPQSLCATARNQQEMKGGCCFSLMAWPAAPSRSCC